MLRMRWKSKIHLLELRKARLDRLIHQARQDPKVEVNSMSFSNHGIRPRCSVTRGGSGQPPMPTREYERRAADQPTDQAEQDGLG